LTAPILPDCVRVLGFGIAINFYFTVMNQDTRFRFTSKLSYAKVDSTMKRVIFYAEVSETGFSFQLGNPVGFLFVYNIC
jgi:hypothetical protein